MSAYFTQEKIKNFNAYFKQVLQILAGNKVKTVYAGSLDQKIKPAEIAMFSDIHEELFCCVGPFSATVKTDIDIFNYLEIDPTKFQDVSSMLAIAEETCAVRNLGITDTRNEFLHLLLPFQNKQLTNFYGLSETALALYDSIKGNAENFIAATQKYSMFQFMPRDLKLVGDATPVFIVLTKNDGDIFEDTPFVVYQPRLSLERTTQKYYLQYSISQLFHKADSPNKILFAFGFPQLINNNENEKYKKVGYVKQAFNTITATCNSLYSQIQAGPYSEANKVIYSEPFIKTRDSLKFLETYSAALKEAMQRAKLAAARKMVSVNQEKNAAIQYAASELPPADDINEAEQGITAQLEEEKRDENAEDNTSTEQVSLGKRQPEEAVQQLQEMIKPQTNVMPPTPPQFINTQQTGGISTRGTATRGGSKQ